MKNVTAIMSFNGPYDWLSNMYLCTIEYNGVKFHSSEQAYQYQKCVTKEDRDLILSTPHPRKTKVLARKIQLVEGWDDVKLDHMYAIVKAKFEQNSDLADKLVATEDWILIEGNWWNDNFWGTCPVGSTQGKNHLGQILMRVRGEMNGTLPTY